MQTWMEKKDDTSKFNTKKKPLEKLKEKKKKQQRAKSKELKKHKEKEVSERDKNVLCYNSYFNKY